MCTVTWIRRVDGFELFCNRDERRTRPAALLPEARRGPSGIEYAAPIDAEAGGTWVAVNERGLALCLLNHYQAAEPLGRDLASRG
ncbi:MAG TPA: NRDE family protein, partial [Planctomycetota bacterium]|nr:NRDE family protein [Planctomycetota bacterium]